MQKFPNTHTHTGKTHTDTRKRRRRRRKQKKTNGNVLSDSGAVRYDRSHPVIFFPTDYEGEDEEEKKINQ